MEETELVYLSEMDLLETTAQVDDVSRTEDRDVVTLDRTIFYPQGGGQPYDTGTIEGNVGQLRVEEVRWSDGKVLHIGTLEGSLSPREPVRLRVDGERRALNTRLHSAGHVVDMAIDRLGLGWVPGKGYHFPQGPYVEYRGRLENDRDEVIAQIEEAANAITAEGHATTVRLVPAEELATHCRFVPDYIPEGKPARVVTYGDFGVACGGTHVIRLSEIGQIRIRKLKPKGDTVRVSYEIS